MCFLFGVSSSSQIIDIERVKYELDEVWERISVAFQVVPDGGVEEDRNPKNNSGKPEGMNLGWILFNIMYPQETQCITITLFNRHHQKRFFQYLPSQLHDGP